MKRANLLLIAAFIIISIAGNKASAKIDPYSFAPKTMRLPGETFKPAKRLVDINPVRPLVVTDKNGNKMYVTSEGDVMVSVDKNGNRTFSLQGRRSHVRNAKNELTRRWENQAGSNEVIETNEFGETVARYEKGMGGKTMAEYDANGNITRTYEYDQYGKNVEWVVDELTQTRVKYDEKGKAIYDVDFEGTKIGTYEYNREGRLLYRVDVYGNKTTYDKSGNRIETVSEEGKIIAKYLYEKDDNGYYQISSIKDENGNITYYKEGKQYEERDSNGTLIKTYKWQGSKLVYSNDIVTGYITWYKNDKPTYTTFAGELVSEWLYHEGKIMGIWHETDDKFQLYSHGLSKMDFFFNRKPEIEELLDIYEYYGIEL